LLFRRTVNVSYLYRPFIILLIDIESSIRGKNMRDDNVSRYSFTMSTVMADGYVNAG